MDYLCFTQVFFLILSGTLVLMMESQACFRQVGEEFDILNDVFNIIYNAVCNFGPYSLSLLPSFHLQLHVSSTFIWLPRRPVQQEVYHAYWHQLLVGGDSCQLLHT